jgi:CubicO group peptidase (beta-lactamase class C family)
MRRRIVCIFMLAGMGLAVAFCAAAAELAWAKSLDELLTTKAEAGFAGAVVVEQNGEIVFGKAYGLANREKSIPWTLDTVYCLGSITKQFTGAAIVKLQDDGKLSVNDLLIKWIPDLPEDKSRITLHHLLTHSAGVPDPYGDDFDPKATEERFLDGFRTAKLLWGPEDFGRKYEYSNWGYSLLAIVVGRASGMPYETYLQKTFFEPLGMTRTGYFSATWKPEDFAHGYARDRDNGVVVLKHSLPDGPSWYLRGNGGICTTFADLRTWHHALLDGRVFDAASLKLLESPFVSEGGNTFYSYGWSVAMNEDGTLRYRGHNGGDGVSFADFRWYPDRNTLFLIASTTAPVGLSNAVGRITQTVFEIKRP